MISQLTKRHNLIATAVLAIVAIAAAVAFSTTASSDEDKGGKHFEVSITNLTKGQIISPAVVATHRSRLDPIFQLGSAASPELAGLAEDASLDPFFDMLDADPNVANVIKLFGAGGPIMPGETASAVISTRGDAREISLAAMLVTTNDVFVGLSGASLPKKDAEHYFSAGYDAGSEANNEDCDFIPGPPCGNGGVRDTAGAEGYVYVSNGVHGIADLVPAMHDWHNPAALIRIKRVRGDD